MKPCDIFTLTSREPFSASISKASRASSDQSCSFIYQKRCSGPLLLCLVYPRLAADMLLRKQSRRIWGFCSVWTVTLCSAVHSRNTFCTTLWGSHVEGMSRVFLRWEKSCCKWKCSISLNPDLWLEFVLCAIDISQPKSWSFHSRCLGFRFWILLLEMFERYFSFILHNSEPWIFLYLGGGVWLFASLKNFKVIYFLEIVNTCVR